MKRFEHRAVVFTATVAAMMAALASCDPGEATLQQEPDLVITWQAQQGGRIQGWGCPRTPLGGLRASGAFAAAQRARYRGSAVYVDIGNTIAGSLAPSIDDAERSFTQLQLSQADAWLPGPVDLLLGTDRLRTLISTHGVPTISTNVAATDSEETLFQSSLVVRRNHLMIAFVGLLLPSPDTEIRLRSHGYRLLETEAAIARATSIIAKQRPDAVVALVSLENPGDERLKSLLRSPAVTFFLIGSRSNDLLPYQAGGAAVFTKHEQEIGQLALFSKPPGSTRPGPWTHVVELGRLRHEILEGLDLAPPSPRALLRWQPGEEASKYQRTLDERAALLRAMVLAAPPRRIESHNRLLKDL
jgi:hypothetical protein